jgi:oligosaccharide repeat unit polymerase
MIVVALAVLLPVGLAARFVAGRWLRPGGLFAGYWAVAGIAPLLLLRAPLVGARSLLYIGAAMILFAVGSRIGALGKQDSPQQTATRPLNPAVLKAAIAIGSAGGVLATLVELRTHGLSLAALTSTSGLLATGNSIAVDRYTDRTGDATTPVVAILLAFTYTAAVIAPYARVLANVGRKWLAAPMLSALLYSTVTTARLALLIAGACTIGGYLAARTARDGDAPALTRKAVVTIVSAFAAIGIAFSAIAFVRVGSLDSAYVPVVRDKLAAYAAGYGPAFSAWLDRYEDPRNETTPLGYGTASLAGVSMLTGQDRAGTRAYGEFELIDEHGAMSNIYTMFRGLIFDFGTFGAGLAVALLGWIAGRAYRRATADSSPAAAGVLGCVFAIILTSNIMSIVSFRNVLVGMAGAVFVLWRAAVRIPALSSGTC